MKCKENHSIKEDYMEQESNCVEKKLMSGLIVKKRKIKRNDGNNNKIKYTYYQNFCKCSEKVKCLKEYCSCFKQGKLCTPMCKCVGCCNT